MFGGQEWHVVDTRVLYFLVFRKSRTFNLQGIRVLHYFKLLRHKLENAVVSCVVAQEFIDE